LDISEAANRAMVFPELMNSANKVWARCVKEGCLVGPDEMMRMIDKLTVEQVARLFFVEESLLLPQSDNVRNLVKGVIWPANRRVLTLPVKMNKPIHQPHLKNFFDAIRGRAQLNCPAEAGYKTAVAVLKVNEAVQAGRKLTFGPEEFKV